VSRPRAAQPGTITTTQEKPMTMTALAESAELFSGEQILTAIAALSEYDRYVDVSALEGGEYDAETLEAFAKLARSLKATVKTYGLKIRREKPRDQLREIALRRLQAQVEAGEIEPAYPAFPAGAYPAHP
jgi:hypothetical protein